MGRRSSERDMTMKAGVRVRVSSWRLNCEPERHIASWSWRRKEVDPPLESAEGTSPAYPSRIPKRQDNIFVLLQATSFGAVSCHQGGTCSPLLARLWCGGAGDQRERRLWVLMPLFFQRDLGVWRGASYPPSPPSPPPPTAYHRNPLCCRHQSSA
jgi:hypothetical protein